VVVIVVAAAMNGTWRTAGSTDVTAAADTALGIRFRVSNSK